MVTEVHFFESEDHFNATMRFRDEGIEYGIYNGWKETSEVFAKCPTGLRWVFTTQMGLLSTDLLGRGCRVFVHNSDEEKPLEICLGSNTWTDKEIRKEHNLFKMWQAGAIRS